MGRKPEFSDEQVFGWLARHLASEPSATVHQVSKGTGVSVGSLYHRYGSLETLFARAWLWAAQGYHERTVWILGRKGPRPALRIARQVLAMARDDRDRSLILFCIPKRMLVRNGADEAVRAEISKLEADWDSALAGFAERSGLDPDRLRLVLRDLPQTVVARYFPDEEIPQTANSLIEETWAELIGQGEEDSEG